MNKKTKFRFIGKLIDEKTSIEVIIDRGIVVDLKEKDKLKSRSDDVSIIFSPLLFDAQVNGGFGVSIQDEELDDEKLLYLSRRLLSLGVAKWIPTVVTAPSEKIQLICEKISSAITSNSELSKHIAGIHLEGPWISPLDGPRGAHPRQYVRPPSLEEWYKYKKAGKGKIVCVTLAPELDRGFSLSKRLIKEGVKVSLGHHQADIEILEKAVETGIYLFTHLGNGISNFVHRHNNPMWFALGNDKVAFSIIADGFHLPEYVIKTVAKVKDKEKVFLVSDSTQFLGMRPGTYKEFDNEVELLPNGKLCLKGTPYLAGSASSLLTCLNHWFNISKWPLRSCVRSCSVIPSKLLGIKFIPYQLKLNHLANFMILKKYIDKGLIKLTPLAVFFEGSYIVFEENM